ncbi:uncharacterized protein LOC134188648 [Corticium candelabrum]|uniref:uncharacterized protein LOC134188648 n=1 Tax=Corticium candelabrum TaxID=121492 RepID=UPI002E275D76|nr:uncharacterized protein LOC134188648 [Corticium candelabrum]
MTVLVCSSDDDMETVVESYTCEMSYMGGNLCVSRNGEEVFDSSGGKEIKESTVRLMRSLLLSMQTFDSLPGELYIYLKLAYYPDVTPDDYHPHGFVQAQPNAFKFAGEDSLKFIIGQVHTPFHSIGVHVKSVFCQEWKPGGEDKEIDLSQTEHSGEKKQMEVDIANRSTTEQTASKALTSVKPQAILNDKKSPGLRKGSTLKKRVPTPHSKVIEDKGANQQSRQVALAYRSCSPDLPVQEAARPESATSPVYTVRCPCHFSMDDGLMVQCELCNTWQHCICFGLVTELDVPSIHCCVVCSKERKVSCTDPNLATLHGVALRAMCLWRKAVFAVLTEHTSDPFTNSDLAERLDIEMSVSQGILRRLEREGFVKPKCSIGRGKKSFIAAKTLSVLELKEYFKESIETFQMKGKSAGCNVQENQVESLTQKTAGLQLINRKRAITDLTENSFHHEESTTSPDKRLYSKRLARRALERMGAPPPADCTHDSELMDSQPKRRKQSISKKAIRV